MTDETNDGFTGGSRPTWDLDQYSVKARQERRAQAREEIATAAAEGGGGKTFHDKYVTDQDDGDWLAPAESKQRPRFVESGTIFWISFIGAILSALTVGLYRFWMITSLRRAYAGSIRIDGDPIEYTGTGFEKMLGFLIAVALLAVYLGIANVLLIFAGISSLDAGVLFAPVSLVAVLPFIFWAQYRGQRYFLSRLNWRGIRFGLGGGAWGYTLRSLLWSLAAILTLGLLYPYLHFKQAKYVTDRSFFGSIPMKQEGSWLGLLAYWIWLYISLGLVFLAAWGLAEEMKLGEEGISIMLAVFMPFAMLLVFIMFMNYQIGAFRYLWDNRRIGLASIENDVTVGSIVWAYIKGSFLVSFLTMLVGAIAGVVFVGGGILLTTAILGGQEGATEFVRGDLLTIFERETPPTLDELTMLAPVLIGVALSYFFFFAASFAFGQSLITQPILRLKVEAMLIRRPEALLSAQQRDKDQMRDAGGFADALGVDLGAGLG
ncbi:MAG: DUF898 family protein [Pseudomonadota bacterium]